MLKLLSALVATLLFASSLCAEELFCLNAIEKGDQGARPVRCTVGETDPLNLKNNADINSVMKLFGLDPTTIVFKGCEGLGFHTYGAADSNGAKYLISYSSEANEKAIAAVIHELGHVVQLNYYGGYASLLKRYPSIRIELGADYLAGIAYKLVLNKKDLKDFEQNIELAGFYIPSNINDEHGNPSKRNQAFRLGVFDESNSESAAKLHQNFQDNHYARIQ